MPALSDAVKTAKRTLQSLYRVMAGPASVVFYEINLHRTFLKSWQDHSDVRIKYRWDNYFTLCLALLERSV